MGLKTVCLDVIVIPAGTNNIRRGASATETMGDIMDLRLCKTTNSHNKNHNWQSAVPEKYVITLKGESPQSWTGYAVFVTASWLMETAGLGNSTEPKMGYT
jgi:hypothetical protein